MNYKEMFMEADTLGILVKLGENTWVLSRKHKDIEKGTITRLEGRFDIKTNQASGKNFQFMVRRKDGVIVIGARPTNAQGRALELDKVSGDLDKVAKKFSTIKAIEKFLKDNVDKLN